MPNTHETLSSLFDDMADAIRGKDGTSAEIVADTFPERILAIPAATNMQSKTVGPSTSVQVVTPDQDYDGLSSVTVNAMRLQEKTVEPSTSQIVVTPDEGPTVGFEQASYTDQSASGNTAVGVYVEISTECYNKTYTRINGIVTLTRSSNRGSITFTFNNAIFVNSPSTGIDNGNYMIKNYTQIAHAGVTQTINSGTLFGIDLKNAVYYKNYSSGTYKGSINFSLDHQSSAGEYTVTGSNLKFEYSDDIAFAEGFDALGSVTINAVQPYNGEVE